MSLYDYLYDKFGKNNPFFTSDIEYKNYSRPWLYKELNKLCDESKIIRFERGLYYIPEETIFGPSILNPNKVIEKKYIFDGEQVIGYYSGISFLNLLGLTTQMSNVIEVYTNNEPSNVRTLMVGTQRVLLRKSRADITRENVAVLSFLELMNFVPFGFINDERQGILMKYIKKNGINRKAISQYAPLFPDKAIRNLVESELIYSVEQ